MKRSSFVMQSGLALRALAVIIVMLTATTARADDSGYCGDPNVHGGQDVTWSLTDEDGDNVKETLTITGSGAMKDYDDDTPWYNNRLNIKTVVIEDGVTSIGKDAFYFCEGMTSVTIPSSVTSIGKTAFLGCTGLASVTIPSSVTTIGELAFNRCQSLTSVTIPSSVTTIESYAFSECTGLSSVTIPSSVTSIEERTFLACSSLTSVTIPSSVTNIGNSAFEGCTSLKSVIIPSSVTSIGDMAFDHCTSLSSVTIPSSVTSIEPYVFRNCTSLSSITIPASVTSIGNSAFYGCTSLKSVFMLANSTVDDEAFDFNVQGKKFYVPSGSADNYSYYFYGSDIIEFDGYCGDPDVNGGKNVAWVLTDEDGDSENVKETLTIFGTGAMNIYDFLNLAPWYGNANINTVVIKDGVTSIGDYAFYECTGLTSVTIPCSVTSIGNWAFQSCTGLTSVPIPEGVICINCHAFRDCSGLTSVIIPASVTSIEYLSFSGTSALESITVKEGNPKYDSRDGCNAIIETVSNTLITGCKNTVIPDGVTSIENYAFEGCSNLTSVTIPSNVTSIGIEAFLGCTSLTSVTIPSSVTSIEPGVFLDCTSLTSVTIPSSVTSIWGNAFKGCTNVTDVYCYADPDGLTWEDAGCDDFIVSPDKKTVCHVAGSKKTKFEEICSDVNVNFEGDGIEPGGVAYIPFTDGSGNRKPLGDDVQVYAVTGYNLTAGQVYLKPIEDNVIPKGMPVVIGNKTEDDPLPANIFLVGSDAQTTTVEGLLKGFVACDGSKTVQEYLDESFGEGVSASDYIPYLLKGGTFKAVLVNAADVIKQDICLLFIPKWDVLTGKSVGSTNATRSIGIGEGGETTRIRPPLTPPTQEGKGCAQWYDMQGRRIEKPTRKGLYIRNGVKVVIK